MNVANQISHYLNRFTVGIAGCGGLGSNCAVVLARVGIGRLIIADFGIVTAQNFKRGYYFNDQIGRLKVSALKENIQRINPKIIVKVGSKNSFFQGLQGTIRTHLNLHQISSTIIRIIFSLSANKFNYFQFSCN